MNFINKKNLIKNRVYKGSFFLRRFYTYYYEGDDNMKKETLDNMIIGATIIIGIKVVSNIIRDRGVIKYCGSISK